MLYRKIQKKIEEKLQKSNKILLIDGARQVGKTYIIRVICNKLYRHFNEVNLMDDYNGNQIFAKVRTVEDFKLIISSMFGNNLGAKEETMIFLDEIQVYPHLLTMLKFLKEDNRYNYICSGSELGIALSGSNSIPIGYIEKIRMYPLDFEEFLYANSVGKEVVMNMKDCFNDKKELPEALHVKILSLFKKYLLIGGLPDAINSYIKENNIQLVRDIHNEIYNYYKDDAAKYDKNNKLKIMRIYDSIPSTLENKKKRIVIKNIEGIKGKTRKNYQDEFDYLINSGIALNVEAISNPVFPLRQSEDKNLLKLYINDVGLLSSIYYKNNVSAILDDSLSINLGTLYENVVAMELSAHGHKLFYYDNKKNGEIDYLIDDYENSAVIPIEIKSGKNYSIHNAIDKYLDRANYSKTNGYVFSNEYKVYSVNKLWYMPIYYIMFI